MSRFGTSKWSRRQLIQSGVMLGMGLSALRSPPSLADTDALPLITRPIPSTGERIPVVGIGALRFKNERGQIPQHRDVLRRLPELGGTVIDTAHSYHGSEEEIGRLTTELGNRKQLFIATKLRATGDILLLGRASFIKSFRRLQTDRIDLMQVHNLVGVDAIMPKLLEWKQQGKIRYVGITTSKPIKHPQMMELMKRHPIDFIQVDYSLANRDSANEVLPLAQERRIAVLVNVPFAGRNPKSNLVALAGPNPLPEWAAEFDVKSWGQFFLKYIVSHPAVTCVIPGTANTRHLEDNIQAARGRLPDEAMRRRMEQFWDSSGWAAA